MAITDYNSLILTVGRWSGYGEDSPLPNRIRNAAIDAITGAENDIDDLLRVAEMVKRSTFLATSEFASLPSDCLKPITIGRLEDGREIPVEEKPEKVITDYQLNYQGPVSWYAQVGLELRLAPKPTADLPFSGRITYFARPDRLSDAAPCTALLLRYPMVYLYGALKHIAHFIEDDAKQAKWENLQVQQITRANRTYVIRKS